MLPVRASAEVIAALYHVASVKCESGGFAVCGSGFGLCAECLSVLWLKYALLAGR